MKEIIRITVGLTISCLIAAVMMGSVFIITDKAKKHNEHVTVQTTMLALLGYNKANPAPSDLQLHNLYRYIIEEGDVKTMGYMVPVEEGYDLVVMDLDGQFVNRYDLNISPHSASEAPERASALREVIKPPKTFLYADSTIVATLGGKRVAYLLPGEFPGFKTFIDIMLALDPSFQIIGLEIMEHEEDPGLGAEIEQPYFKNQFRGKTLENVKTLEVIKEPLPAAYRKYLEAKPGIPKGEIDAIKSQYQYQDIYALTGATISSSAVTNGVKNIIKKFAYRVERLDSVLASQHIPVVF
jgi:electron transport complex protein RnfG